MRTFGEIEETTNTQTGRLDLPPFAPTGTADSFFDVFFEIVLPDGTILHNRNPKHLRARITHKPPGELEFYETIDTISLFLPNGEPSGFAIGAGRHIPRPVEVDHFPDSHAVVEIVSPLGTEVVKLRGPTMVEVDLANLGDPDGNSREQVPTEIIAMELTGVSPTLGLIRLRRSPVRPSLGEIEETTNTQPGRLDLPPFAPEGTADSFFDVFFEIVLADGRVLHNVKPKHLRSRITHKPPAGGEWYENPEAIELFDENGEPTGIFIGANRHTPDPIEVDHFPNSYAEVEFSCPGIPPEVVMLKGPTTVEVDLGALADTDGNAREQVPTEIVALQLTGESSIGPILLRQSPTMRTLGKIEETTNNTPGVLDIPPFTHTGTADSFFDVFFEVEVPELGVVLHNEKPKRLTTRITHKPPAGGEAYEGLDVIPLFGPDGTPTGCELGATRHVPSNPPCPGDFDMDGDVDGTDLRIFIRDFGRIDCVVGPPCPGDFDMDGDVDRADLRIFIRDFGRIDCGIP
jgi:hypothetical protein